MGIDPSSPLCEPFYAKCRELGMVLLSHCGEEKVEFAGPVINRFAYKYFRVKAVSSDKEFQLMGNPLLFSKVGTPRNISALLLNFLFL